MGASSDVCKLSDLMLAKAMEGKMAQHITKSGELLGDISCMAPERTSGLTAEVDERSDVYSLGVTLYTVLAGRPPFQAASPVQTLLQIRQGQLQPLRIFQPAVPEGLEAIILKMLAREPAQRFANAGELVASLETFARLQNLDF
jgi:serine/threonine protein kinase